MNTIEIFENGPIYFHGDVEVQDMKGNTILKKEKVAFCRCGGSGNKPLCDGTHKKNGFTAEPTADTSDLPKAAEKAAEKLILKPSKNGPILVEGTYTLKGADIKPSSSNKNIALCRCGGSANKPFCDGTHKKIGFEAA